jgi:outer membrane protein assembly factor BamB
MAVAGCGSARPPGIPAKPLAVTVTTPAAPAPATLPAVTGSGVRALWQGAPWGNLTFAGGTLLGSDGNQVHAIRAATGAPLWTATMPAAQPDVLGLVPAGNVVIVEAGHSVGNPPAMVASAVFEYIALDLATGAERWTAPALGGNQSPAIAASGKFVLTGDPSGAVTARLAATGSVVWRVRRPAVCGAAAPSDLTDDAGLGLAADGPLLAASFSCERRVVVVRLDPATGKALWTWRSPAIIEGDSLSLTATAAARDGNLVLLAGQIASPPAAQQFISRLPHADAWPQALGPADQISTVLALDAANGRPRWSELGGQLETFTLTVGAVCEVVSAGLECRDDATGAATMPTLRTGMHDGDSPPYADDGFAGVSGGLAAVTAAPSRSSDVTLRIVTVRGGTTAAQVRLAIGSTPTDGSNYQVFAVAAAPLSRGTTLVLVRRVDLPGYPALALAIPDPSLPKSQNHSRSWFPISSAAFSAMARTVAFGWALGITGMTEASATRRPAIPCTRSSASTTAPIPQVPAGW